MSIKIKRAAPPAELLAMLAVLSAEVDERQSTGSTTNETRTVTLPEAARARLATDGPREPGLRRGTIMREHGSAPVPGLIIPERRDQAAATAFIMGAQCKRRARYSARAWRAEALSGTARALLPLPNLEPSASLSQLDVLQSELTALIQTDTVLKKHLHRGRDHTSSDPEPARSRHRLRRGIKIEAILPDGKPFTPGCFRQSRSIFFS